MNFVKNEESARISWCLAALTLGFFTIAAQIIFRAPLQQSFWLDETITTWVASGSVKDAVSRAWNYKQSLLFHLWIWGWRNVVGADEILLRLPSLLATFCSAFLVFRLGSRLSEPLVGVLAATLFLASDSTILSAVSVRPYAYAQCAFLFALDRLLSFRDSKRGVDLIFVVCAFLVSAMCHYLFAASILVIASCAFLLCPSGSTKNRMQLKVTLAVCALIAVTSSVIVANWSLTGPALGFAATPTFQALFFEIVPISYLVYAAVPLVLGLLYNGWNPPSISRQSLIILCLWVVVIPVFFFFVSRFSSTSVWVPRYWSWQVPGLALGYALLIASVCRGSKWWIAICAFVGMILLREGGRIWNPESWRELAASVREQTVAEGRCEDGVYLVSGLVEAKQREFVEARENKDYLVTALAVYGVPSVKIIPSWESLSFLPDPSITCLAGINILGAQSENPVFRNLESQISGSCNQKIEATTLGMLRLIECVR